MLGREARVAADVRDQERPDRGCSRPTAVRRSHLLGTQLQADVVDGLSGRHAAGPPSGSLPTLYVAYGEEKAPHRMPAIDSRAPVRHREWELLDERLELPLDEAAMSAPPEKTPSRTTNEPRTIVERTLPFTAMPSYGV